MSEPAARTDRLSERLTALLAQLRDVRGSESLNAFRFTVVNGTANVVPYRQAVLFEKGAGGRIRIHAASGASKAERNAPYVAWMRKVVARVLKGRNEARSLSLTAEDLPAKLAAQWEEWLPPFALVVPLAQPDGRFTAGLLIARERPFSTADGEILQHLAEGYAEVWRRWRRPMRSVGLVQALRTVRWVAVLAALIVIGLIPVPKSSLAPAEIIAADPSIVRAGVDGVIDELLVKAHEPVTRGQPLFHLDETRLRNQRDVARGALQVAEAEYRQAATQAVGDQRSKLRLTVLKGTIERKRAELNYVTTLLERVNVLSPAEGIVLIDEPDEWVGRPVRIGERLAMVADPRRVRIEIRLPASEPAMFTAGARTELFLNVDPDNALQARLSHVGYQAQPDAAGVMAYRLEAELEPGQKTPRIGLKGVARIYGEETRLAWLLFHRPYVVVRQWLGW